MKCSEFHEHAAGLTIGEPAREDDKQFLAHQRECAGCASWLQQRQALAGALQALRSSTATLEAPVGVEHAVLRAFRQSAAPVIAPEKVSANPFFGLGRFFGWGAYAAVAAALALSLGLGIWFWQNSRKTPSLSAQSPAATQPQAATSEISQQQPPEPTQAERQLQASSSERRVGSRPSSEIRAANTSNATANQSSDQSLTQMAQAQGYVPLMLCDPLSCAGDEQVVRMEIPANAVDASSNSSEPLLADVVLGEDGLVRAIRIVQQ